MDQYDWCGNFAVETCAFYMFSSDTIAVLKMLIEKERDDGELERFNKIAEKLYEYSSKFSVAANGMGKFIRDNDAKGTRYFEGITIRPFRELCPSINTMIAQQAEMLRGLSVCSCLAWMYCYTSDVNEGGDELYNLSTYNDAKIQIIDKVQNVISFGKDSKKVDHITRVESLVTTPIPSSSLPLKESVVEIFTHLKRAAGVAYDTIFDLSDDRHESDRAALIFRIADELVELVTLELKKRRCSPKSLLSTPTQPVRKPHPNRETDSLRGSQQSSLSTSLQNL